MLVVVLLALIWAAVLVPPAVLAHRERQEAFLVSLGPAQAAPAPRPHHSYPVQRRRHIAGGLLIAMAATLVVGLLPTFRVLLIVHLFLLDSFLAYVGMLAHQANRAGRAGVRSPRPAVVVEPAPRSVPRPVISPAL